MLCDTTLPYADIMADDANRFTLRDCADDCSFNPGCNAFIWDEQCRCQLTTNATLSTTSIEEGTLVGFAHDTQMTPPDPTVICPYPNLSTQNAVNGAPFNIFCGAIYVGGDLSPDYISSTPDYNVSPIGGFHNGWSWHADSFNDCMDMCATSHPLCRVFQFAPGYAWANCFLKNATDLVPLGFASFHSHVGVISESKWKLERDKTCKTNESTTAGAIDGSRLEFTLSCNDMRLPKDNLAGIMAQRHEKSVHDCISACASEQGGTQSSTCIAALFDQELWYGWDNCYLLTEIPQGVAQQNYTSAYLSSERDNFTPPAGQLSGTSDEAAKIAAPTAAVGSIILLSMVLFKFRRGFRMKILRMGFSVRRRSMHKRS